MDLAAVVATPLSQKIDRTPLGDRDHPGRKASRGIVGLACAMDRQQDVLDDIVDPVGLQAAPDHAPDQRRALPQKPTIGGFVSSLRRCHQSRPARIEGFGIRFAHASHRSSVRTAVSNGRALILTGRRGRREGGGEAQTARRLSRQCPGPSLGSRSSIESVDDEARRQQFRQRLTARPIGAVDDVQRNAVAREALDVSGRSTDRACSNRPASSPYRVVTNGRAPRRSSRLRVR